jgi:type IX secretion system PorP/SprF family membrane protein
MCIMKNVRSAVLILIFQLLFCLTGKAVSDSTGISLGYPVYSQYLQNGLLINPAYSGTRGALSGFLSYRMQWMGIDDAPVFQTISFHAPMKNDRVALGIMGQFMHFGFTRSKSIYASYAYNIRLGPGRLSFGLKGGVDVSNTDYTGINLTTPGDPVFTENGKSYILPNIGTGVYYYTDKLFAGISIPQFLSYKKTSASEVQAYHSFGNYDIIFSAGGLFTISDLLKFKPSTLVNYSLRETKRLVQLDLNGNFILNDLIWIGGSWRTTEKVIVGILQLQLNPQLMLGFSYDYPIGTMNSFSKGSSEFIIRYEFGSRISAANPKYF